MNDGCMQGEIISFKFCPFSKSLVCSLDFVGQLNVISFGEQSFLADLFERE